MSNIKVRDGETLRSHIEHVGCKYSREKHCQCTKVQRHFEATLRITKYATTNLRRNLIRQN